MTMLRNIPMETVRFLVKLTDQGKLRWQKDGPDTYSTSIAGQDFKVEFLYFAPTDERGADRSVVRLDGLVYADFAVGTQGFDLICKMLATSEPELNKWRTDCEARWLERINALKAKIRKLGKNSKRRGRRKAS